MILVQLIKYPDISIEQLADCVSDQGQSVEPATVKTKDGLARRLKVLRGIVENRLIRIRVLSKLWGPLTKIVEDPQLKKASSQMQKKVKAFKKLRKALRIAVPNSNQGFNDDGQEVNMKGIEEKVKHFRKEIGQDKDYTKMIEQIDKYWDKLFADPITVDTPTGQLDIQPQRANNILERFFRDLKRRNRKRSGTLSLNKTLKSILADTPLGFAQK